jgi:sigma-B regulation protein RsbU (phosphoserine phosphatase)
MDTTLPGATPDIINQELQVRRVRLQAAIAQDPHTAPLQALLQEVDAAIARIGSGLYGLCETCHEPIEAERLIADPLVRFCLDHMTAAEQRALEDDLRLAARIQSGLLPPASLAHNGWQAAYVYRPHGVVSGDYCDLVPAADGSLYFMLGDVSGKGVAASMLMAHLHAMLRTLIEVGLPLAGVMERASRLFCESTLPTHYATLVVGHAMPDGRIAIANAGHPPPVLLGAKSNARVEATGLPVGMFCSQQFDVAVLQADRGDVLVLCSDGVSETEDPSGSPYGLERFVDVAAAAHDLEVASLVAACHDDVTRFRSTATRTDDVTVMAVRRSG